MELFLQRWPERHSHADQAVINRMIDHEMVKGAIISSNDKPSTYCNRCIIGKIYRAPISEKRDSQEMAVLVFVQSDFV